MASKNYTHLPGSPVKLAVFNGKSNLARDMLMFAKY